MSIATLVLGQSGTGKSTSLRNLDPTKTLLIQSIKKPLPFRSKDWQPCTKENPQGSILVTDKPQTILSAIERTKKEIIVIDDFQYVMANEYMRRAQETGFNKFTEIGKGAWDIFTASSKLAESKRVYILSHTQENDNGKTSIKTIGKMLDEKITLEGMVTICLKTAIINEQYVFSTKNNGQDTTKAPMGLFESEHIENDLQLVDKAICEYWSI